MALPISGKTNYPQKLVWIHHSEYGNFMYLNSKEKKMIAYSINYLSTKIKFQVSFKAEKKNIINFQTDVFVSENRVKNIYTTFIIEQEKNEYEFNDQTKRDLIQFHFKLPHLNYGICDEFVIFRSPLRQAGLFQYNVPRVILLASKGKLNVILPISCQYYQMKIDYIPPVKNEIKLSKKSLELLNLKNAMINYNPADVEKHPFSGLPFYFYSNNLLMIGAPKGFITTILIGQKDMPRCFFQTKIPDTNEFSLFDIASLKAKTSHFLSKNDGKILKCEINLNFFIQRDPRYIIPLLHLLNNSNVTFNFKDVITEDVIKTFWNCDVFNEILLICFNNYIFNKFSNQSIISHNFEDNVCATFARPHFFDECTDKFKSYYPKNNNEVKYTSFQDFENSKIFLSDLTEIPDYSQLSKILLELLECEFNDNRKINFDNNIFRNLSDYYDEQLHFPIMLQIASLKYSFLNSSGLSINDFKPFVDFKLFPQNFSTLILEYWNANEIIGYELEENKEKDFNEENNKQNIDLLKTNFICLKSNIYNRNELSSNLTSSLDEQSMVQMIEGVVNRAGDYGPLLFNYMQVAYGVSFNEPIFDIN